jgi:hypothetical protein
MLAMLIFVMSGMAIFFGLPIYGWMISGALLHYRSRYDSHAELLTYDGHPAAFVATFSFDLLMTCFFLSLLGVIVFRTVFGLNNPPDQK